MPCGAEDSTRTSWWRRYVYNQETVGLLLAQSVPYPGVGKGTLGVCGGGLLLFLRSDPAPRVLRGESRGRTGPGTSPWTFHKTQVMRTDAERVQMVNDLRLDVFYDDRTGRRHWVCDMGDADVPLAYGPTWRDAVDNAQPVLVVLGKLR